MTISQQTLSERKNKHTCRKVPPLLQSGSLKGKELTWSGKRVVKLVHYLVFIIDKHTPQETRVF